MKNKFYKFEGNYMSSEKDKIDKIIYELESLFDESKREYEIILDDIQLDRIILIMYYEAIKKGQVVKHIDYFGKKQRILLKVTEYKNEK